MDEWDSIVHLSKAVGWDYHRKEVEIIFKNGTVFGIQDNGKLVACGALISYDEQKIGSIGMVIVHPSHQGKGLGRKLTEACINKKTQTQSLMLIATKEGEPLYRKVGFQTTGRIVKYTNPSATFFNDLVQAQPFERFMFQDVVDLDAMAFGERREGFLQDRIKQASKAYVLIKDEGIVGYGLAIDTPYNRIIGPLICNTEEGAIDLIRALLLGYSGRVRIDMPEKRERVEAFLQKAGFSLSATPPLMVKGELPDRNGTLISIVDVTDFEPLYQDSFKKEATFMKLFRCQLYQLHQKRSVSIVNNTFSIRFESGKKQTRTLNNLNELERVLNEEFHLPQLPVEPCIEFLQQQNLALFK
ncbi:MULTISPECIES: GNAT family N-acetyltransferase [Bacillaceae]|uniref:GNAT family N-acetyltransferase n=1 Tax=Shouchella oshimensis TaxID=290588 RepID=UPI0006EBFA31|nr:MULTISPECIES: GNAT family N-acetyltransferase [Bacillaceae]